jgi:tRNA pseudouridine32 synthase/23S rRNA pseudouridine746 synthase
MDVSQKPVELEVLYEDEDCLAVNKPAGLLSVSGRGPDKTDCVVARAAVNRGWIRECHRLDQATSGVMLLAKNPAAHRRYSGIFAAREAEKRYIAVTGMVPRDPRISGVLFSGDTIILNQRLDPEHRPMQVVDWERGKEAVTQWHVNEALSERTAGYKVISLRPLTGRTHQLRLAMSVCGAPILGDRLYAPEDIQGAASRLMLHAEQLRVPRINGPRDDLDIKCPAPFLSTGEV